MRDRRVGRRYRYDGIFQEVERGENRMDSTSGAGCRKRKVGSGVTVRHWALTSGGEGEEKTYAIIRSRTEQRSCTLRDRTQNGAGVPPGPGTTHRRQSKCTYERVRMVAMALVAEGRVGTKMTSRKMNRFWTVSTFLKKLGKLKPGRDNVGQRANPNGIHQT